MKKKTRPELATVPRHMKTLVIAISLEIGRRWNPVNRSAIVEITGTALQFSKSLWLDVFRLFRENGWNITPIEPVGSRPPAFRFTT